MSRTMSFLIFFCIVLLIYGSANYYVYIRVWQLVKSFTAIKCWYTILFTFIAASYVIARLLERVYLSTFTDVLTWIGSFWMAALVYLLLFFLVVDILRLVCWLLPGISFSSITGIPNLRLFTAIGVAFTLAVLLSTGYYFATRPRVTRLNVCVEPKDASEETIKIAMVSDIHLGTLVAKNRLQRLINIINENHPDIILLAGDIVDEDLAPVIRQNLGDKLELLQAPRGIWAITGNHEYIGGAENAVAYLEKHNIRFLRDTVVKIEGCCWLAGREDRDSERFSGKKRKPLEEIIRLTDNTLPIILMDHQPFHLDSAVHHGVDLQLSGHTHQGQQWPFNLITNKLYEVSHGYLRKGDTHFYVSSGYGTWGPPVRLGSRSEIVVIDLEFVR